MSQKRICLNCMVITVYNLTNSFSLQYRGIINIPGIPIVVSFVNATQNIVILYSNVFLFLFRFPCELFSLCQDHLLLGHKYIEKQYLNGPKSPSYRVNIPWHCFVHLWFTFHYTYIHFQASYANTDPSHRSTSLTFISFLLA